MISAELELPPWQHKKIWEQVKIYIEVSVEQHWEKLRSARAVTKDIFEKLALLDPALDSLCRHTCVSCCDICCSRATVWYDFRDLLILYLATGAIPDEQVRKRDDLSCSCLTANGCMLKRRARPFVCSWYICPEQTEALNGKSLGGGFESVVSVLQQIKSDRKLVEEMFVNTVNYRDRSK